MQVLKLIENATEEEAQRAEEFTQWLLKIGETPDKQFDLPKNLCLEDPSIGALGSEIFPNLI